MIDIIGLSEEGVVTKEILMDFYQDGIQNLPSDLNEEDIEYLGRAIASYEEVVPQFIDRIDQCIETVGDNREVFLKLKSVIVGKLEVPYREMSTEAPRHNIGVPNLETNFRAIEESKRDPLDWI